MENFSEQCIDLARSLLSQNLQFINDNGTITPFENEDPREDESGHAALAIGEFYRATGETKLDNHDLVDLAARCITAQAYFEDQFENGLAHASLGLLSFGPAKSRNQVWERLLQPTKETLDNRLLARSDYDNHFQVFNIAKAVARFSMGLSKKDETGKLIDKFIERVQSSGGVFCDDAPGTGIGGVYDIYGVLSYVTIRQALQLHVNSHLRERKLPSLRTYAERYIKLIPDLVRQDGMGWTYGRGAGIYGQMHLISMTLQALRDGWISDQQKPVYLDALKRLFQFFFMTFIDQEHGVLVIRDHERNAYENHTTRMANFDVARYLCQWSRLAKVTNESLANVPSAPLKSISKFVSCQKSHKKEQGLFIYQNPNSGLHLQIPLMGSGKQNTSDSLPFPHCPGVFDWPVNKYLPVMLPELTFGDNVVIPAFYGKRCTTGLGLRKSFYFRYEQPDLINTNEEIISNLGSAKVNWTFLEDKITSEFIFNVKTQVQLDKFRLILPLGAPHSQFHIGTTFTLGEESLRAQVLADDFHTSWADFEVVTEDPEFSTYYGKIHYLQTLKRDHPMVMRPGQNYKITLEYQPDIHMIDSL